jgi:exonuclease SbcD
MDKIALAVTSTDWHLKKENINQIKDLVKQQCELAVRLQAKLLLCLGDALDSRIAQREEILTAFSEILDMIHEYKLKIWIIPGNHDKSDYSSKESFLTPYKDHPALTLVSVVGSIHFNEFNLRLYFLPFLKEENWLSGYSECVDNYLGLARDEEMPVGKNILLTHIAVTGSKNNDGSLVSSTLSSEMFNKDWFKVLSGHYHDQQQIGKNFYHIPSIQQNNFGENPDKGFIVIYSDGSHELVKSKFKEFIKVRIDLDTIGIDNLTLLKQKYQRNDNNIRFEFVGSENKLKSLKKEEFITLGIDVKSRVKEIEEDILFSESEEVTEHTASTLKEEFEKFCIKENLSFETGIKFLNKKLS